MAKEHTKSSDKSPETRDARLKAALRSNMAKRKAQARARATQINKKQEE